MLSKRSPCQVAGHLRKRRTRGGAPVIVIPVKRFQDQVVVVTGGAKGMGAAVSRQFVEEGGRIVCLDIDAEAGEALAASLGASCLFYAVDVRKGEAIREAIQAGRGKFGPVNHLVNSAGVQGYSNALDTTEAEWDRVMEINLKSAWLAARETIPDIQSAGGGCVVNIASVNALHCQRNTLPYATSKAALLGLTRSIALDYGPTVRSVAICPGTVNTPMLEEALATFSEPEKMMQEIRDISIAKRVAEPEEIAKLIAFVCSADGSFMTGQAVRIDGGLGIEIGGVGNS